MKIPLTILIFAISLNLMGMDNNVSKNQQEIVNSTSDQLFTDINRLHSYAHIPKELKNLKKKLNSEFMKEAKINDLVSYIYYPSIVIGGHSEVEAEGICADIDFFKKTKLLDHRLRKIRRAASSEMNFPFFRYVIAVTPEQLAKLRENISESTPGHCAFASLTKLSKNCNYNVPFLFKLPPPLASGLYLHCAKALGSKRISKIEFYGNENRIKNLIILPGVLTDSIVILGVTGILVVIIVTTVLLSNIDTNSTCSIEEYQ